jgi:hypothetical protein
MITDRRVHDGAIAVFTITGIRNLDPADGEAVDAAALDEILALSLPRRSP